MQTCHPPFFRPHLALVSRRWIGRTVACLLSVLAVSVQAWTLDDVATRASQQARLPYTPASHNIPAELANLNYDGYRDIRFNTDRNLWRADQLPFEANFFHVGKSGD